MILFTGSLMGQNLKLPPKGTYYLISNQNCKYPRQTGNLEIIKSDSLKLTNYKTGQTEMIIYRDQFLGFLTDYDKKEEANKVYNEIDRLLTTLFNNGLLTADLLIKAYCIDSKHIDYKGDTLDFTNSVRSKSVKILNIKKKKLPRNYKFKNKKYLASFEIWATFNPNEDGWGSFPMFDLILISDIKYSDSHTNEYFKNAKIKCLLYTNTQI